MKGYLSILKGAQTALKRVYINIKMEWERTKPKNVCL